MSRDESRVAMYATSGKMPRDLFYYDFTRNPPEQLTQSLSSQIKPDDLVNGKVVRFKSFDGVEVPGIMYMPHSATEQTKARP